MSPRTGAGCPWGANGAGAASPTASSTAKSKPGVWHLLPPSPLKAPAPGVTAAWDGAEFVVVGCPGEGPYGTGVNLEAAAYDPATDTWRLLPRPPAGPNGCVPNGDSAVWDGREVLLLGVTNAAYDPATDSWRRLPRAVFVSGPSELSVWTGHRTIGFGGGCCDDFAAMSPSYSPSTDSWSQPPDGPLGGRRQVVGVWDGRELILAGGWRNVMGPSGETRVVFTDAAAYNPATRSWRRLASMPTRVEGGDAVWDGREMLVVGGAPGLAYDPATNRWRALPPMTYPRDGSASVWTGRQALVWGGGTISSGGKVAPPHGEAFDPVTNRWSALPVSPLRGRADPLVVWTGTQMIVWGGYSLDGKGTVFTDGAIYTPGRR